MISRNQEAQKHVFLIKIYRKFVRARPFQAVRKPKLLTNDLLLHNVSFSIFIILTNILISLLCYGLHYIYNANEYFHSEGFQQSFGGGIYPPSVGFTQEFGNKAKQLVPMCGLVYGLGDSIG